MTITTKKTSTITVEGTHTRRHCKPVFCITNGKIYASVTDAAEAIGASVWAVSNTVNRKQKTVKGIKLCLVSDMADYVEEIAESIYALHPKAIAYDAIITEQKRRDEANEKLRRHREACEKLRKQMEIEMQKLAEAEAEVKSLGMN